MSVSSLTSLAAVRNLAAPTKQSVGKAAHGSRTEQGIDAILPLRAALGELERIRSELHSRPPDALLGHASLHSGTIEGGTELSVVPARARLQWERRTLPDEEPERVDAELRLTLTLDALCVLELVLLVDELLEDAVELLELDAELASTSSPTIASLKVAAIEPLGLWILSVSSADTG